MIECTYVACFKVVFCFVFALCDLIVFMVYWATTYSKHFQTSKKEFFVKMFTRMRSPPCLDVVKRSEYASAEFKVNCLAMFCYIYVAVCFMFEITCIFCHFSTIRFPFKTLASKAFLDRSLRYCIYTVTFRDINILRTLKRLAAATKRFSGKHKFVKIRNFLHR